MTRPDYSVLVPVWNGAPFIARCLDSVAEQTHGSWECIVADDGSADDSRERIDAWIVASGIAVTVLRHPGGAHCGLPATRNLAAARASGRWLAFLDQDDRWMPDKLAQQARYLCETPDADAVSCYPALSYAGIERRPYIDIWARSITELDTAPGGRIAFDRFLTGCPYFMSGAVVRREAFDSAGGFDVGLPRTYDWFLWASLASRKPLGVVRKRLATYGLHERNEMERLASEPCGLMVACLEIQERLVGWVAADRGIAPDEAARVVRDQTDWVRAAREAGIDRESWWQLLAGTVDNHDR